MEGSANNATEIERCGKYNKRKWRRHPRFKIVSYIACSHLEHSGLFIGGRIKCLDKFIESVPNLLGYIGCVGLLAATSRDT